MNKKRRSFLKCKTIMKEKQIKIKAIVFNMFFSFLITNSKRLKSILKFSRKKINNEFEATT